MSRLAVLAGAFGAAACATTAAPVAPAKPAGSAAESVGYFGIDLYRALASDEAGDLLISPVSISAAFALAYAGARGETAEEIAAALHYPGADDFHAEMGAFLNDLEVDEESRIVALANAVWFDQRSVIEESYDRLVNLRYKAKRRRGDFRGAPNEERIVINKWVEGETRGRIADLIPEDLITRETRAVLVNALYVKARWYEAFYASATKEGPFKLSRNSSIKTPYMHRIGEYQRLKGPGFEALKMPLEKGGQSLIIFRPDHADGLQTFEARLTGPALAGWVSALAASPFTLSDLKAPKTRIAPADSYRLKAALQSLGVEHAFTEAADFSAMAIPAKQTDDGGRGVEIGEVVHKTFFEMDETGVEAAAATAIIELAVSGARVNKAPTPKPFYADRPFFFALIDERAKAPLFLGRLVDPRE
jgi:serpin B